MNGLCCALTGHRDLPENFDVNKVYDALETLIREGYTSFLCGMARGFDLLALQCLADLKQRYHVRIEACIPYAGHGNGLPPEERKKHHELLTWCDEHTVLAPAYYNGCMLARDRYMVDKCDVVLAYCTRDMGGTAYTVKYARTKGKEVRLID